MNKLYRSQTDQKAAGICGGLGEIYHIDSNLVRLGLVFLTLVTHIVPMVITYLIAWVILPEGPSVKK
ncbi:MAG: PspC domain-containing protein [Candidatus Neomarinimicrobiota bacterium]